MDFAKILGEREWRPAVDRVIAAVEARRDRLPDLLALLDHEHTGTVMRAAMALADLGRAHPDWLRPHHAELLAALTPDPIDATNRCLLRYFAELPLADIDPDIEGELLDLAFARGSDIRKTVTIRMWGLQIVANYCERYPELKDELRQTIEDQLETSSAGFRSRGRKMLAGLR